MLETLLTVGAIFGQARGGPSGGDDAGGAYGPVFFFFCLAIAVLTIVAMWKVFVKAGEPGWACIIPIYNEMVLCRIAGKPEWWVLLMFIPIVNIVIGILVSIGVAERFGRSTAFGLGLAFLGFIFFPILGFGSDYYMSKVQRRYFEDDHDELAPGSWPRKAD
jgi:hypothetical protein